MTASCTRSLIPTKQRLRDLQDALQAEQSRFRMAKGIEVLHVAPCGHSECGDAPPPSLPDDCWVVIQGCSHKAPLQATRERIKQATADGPQELSPQQQRDLEALLALAGISEPVSPPPVPSGVRTARIR